MKKELQLETGSEIHKLLKLLKQNKFACEVVERRDTGIAYEQTPIDRKYALREEITSLESLLSQAKQLSLIETGHSSLLDLIETLFCDFRDNFQELDELLKVKTKFYQKYRQKSARCSKSHRLLFSRLESHIQINFSQRAFFHNMIENLTSSLLIGLCQFRVTSS